MKYIIQFEIMESETDEYNKTELDIYVCLGHVWIERFGFRKRFEMS